MIGFGGYKRTRGRRSHWLRRICTKWWGYNLMVGWEELRWSVYIVWVERGDRRLGWWTVWNLGGPGGYAWGVIARPARGGVWRRYGIYWMKNNNLIVLLVWIGMIWESGRGSSEVSAVWWAVEIGSLLRKEWVRCVLNDIKGHTTRFSQVKHQSTSILCWGGGWKENKPAAHSSFF